VALVESLASRLLYSPISCRSSRAWLPWAMAKIRAWQTALALIRSKQDEQGCWALEYSYAGKTWVDFGAPKTAQSVGHTAGSAGDENGRRRG